MCRHPTIVQSSMITYTFSSLMRAINLRFRAVLAVTFSIFIVISHGLSAQGVQVLSADELKNINEQPISKTVKNNAETGKASAKKPSFEHREANGTSIKEYKETGKPTEIVVEGALGTYEMTAPNDSINPKREQDMIRVPTIRMPF